MPIPPEYEDWVKDIFHPVEFDRLEALPEERILGECLKREGWIHGLEMNWGIPRDEAIRMIKDQGEKKVKDPTEPYLPPEPPPSP